MNYKYSTLALAVAAMLTGCGADDNTSINDGNTNVYKPIVKGDVTIPPLHVNGNAKGIYQYFDPNPIARDEGESTYRWIDANDAELSTEQTLFLEYNYLGENLRFCVTPVAKDANNVNHIGEEECSAPGEVLDALGEKPVVDTVVLDNTAPTVGETLTATYNYSHSDNTAEGSSIYSWYADDSQIAGQSTKTLTLLPAETENKAVKFCVIPTTAETYPVQGDEVCSDATAAVLPIVGTAPVVKNVAIAGSPFVNSDLTGSYDYSDDDLDPEGQSNLVWKRDGVDINSATLPVYTTTASDNGTDLTFCVEPVSLTGDPQIGTEVCSSPMSITTKTEAAPVASNVVVSIQSGGMAEAGEVLVSSYTYTQQDGSNEKDSVGQWYVDTVATAQPCITAQACEYTLTKADIGKNITFGIKPVTEFGTEGSEVKSSDMLINGIKISGVLEYDKQLTAVIFGYDGDVATAGHWNVDVSNQSGPDGDLSPTEQAVGSVYTIGNRVAVTTDTNSNLIIDDYDWVADGTVNVDARNFVGKSVQFCLDTDSFGQKCVNAAEFNDVEGGLYFDAADNTKRAIEPIRKVAFGSYTYHRPLTVAEAALKDTAGFGADIPDSTETHTANGIDWAKFAQDTGGIKTALNSCRNLYTTGGDWHLPQSQFTATKYNFNIYTALGNNPPATSADSMIKLTKELVSDVANPDYTISPVYGWPIAATEKVPYGSASNLVATGNFNVVRFYSNGSSANNYTATQAPLITCVSQ